VPENPYDRELLAIYINLRRDCVALEELIAANSDTVDLKELDKAVTVMKVSFKLIKKILRTHGVEGLKNWRLPVAV
jgi:hypothetical protein